MRALGAKGAHQPVIESASSSPFCVLYGWNHVPDGSDAMLLVGED